ncbi:hypothetical protein GCK72_025871 [Caenorhabditis remanei]|uniref:Uncharacterized protein n=1 Tax=Caenorhabditis remanei TaxID=31234 RepID=A0A6A5G3L9_CAERE|nr:hypothetical protein GCK72_025871 [Caenorhabditis remanei]KAF1749403.1 hypothetical protein GCK72_025871 [Caenorhabditis remanei]
MLPFNNVTNTIDSSKQLGIGKVVRYCLICGDKSTGFHYGVLTCEACKGFFRRGHNNEFQCKYKTPCVITMENRNDCKACRLKKCREVGMNKQSHSVQPAKVPIDPIQQDKLEFEWISQQIRRLHLSTYDYSSDRMMLMTIKDLELKNKTETLQHFINEINSDITSFVFFLKSVPLLEEMTPEDKSILMKRHAFSIYLVRSAPAYTDNGFLCMNGGRIAWQKFYDVYGDLGMKMNATATEIREMNFTEAEIGVFLMLIMLQPIPMEDVVQAGFQNVSLLTETYTRFSRILNYQLTTRDPENRLYDKIQGLLDEVNAINNLHKQSIDLIKTNITSFSLPPLFADVFGILDIVLDGPAVE